MKVLWLSAEADVRTPSSGRWPNPHASPRSSCAPGNGRHPRRFGLRMARRLLRSVRSHRRPRRHAPRSRSRSPALTVVGPELPLSLGLVDDSTPRLRVFGPTQAATAWSPASSFAKDFMRRPQMSHRATPSAARSKTSVANSRASVHRCRTNRCTEAREFATEVFERAADA